jgi:hypothetical protein
VDDEEAVAGEVRALAQVVAGLVCGLGVPLHRRVAELDRRPGDLPDHRRLDDPIRDGLSERVVDHHVAEELALLVLGRS